ncbi:IncP-type conjugal transfer protein TrbI [Brucella intermedia]|uniref:Type IV secretion system protein virB10 n=1 Tax=Brucella intermedia M86 TaxID=1234597 RepID=M5JJU5_9HYPH|nr:IncP-type conjugal transfer protein TrbI [Brucella intermedia]ELT46640.1 conjugal transfer protein TrbI [Brucella intermedia M86]
MSSIDLDGGDESGPKIRRLNRLPVIAFIILVVVFIGVVFWGLSQRGFRPGGGGPGASSGQPASDLADELTRGITPGIIGEPARIEPLQTPQVDEDGEPIITNPFQPQPTTTRQVQQIQTPRQPQETEAEWRLRLQREFEEARLREQHRQELASLQAVPTARNSPMAINLSNIEGAQGQTAQGQGGQQPATGTGGTGLPGTGGMPGMQDLYAAAMQAGLGQGGRTDPNNQAGKEAFFNQQIADLGYLPNQVVPQLSPYELKRGSVIPATLETGINSDLPGRITAQVRQHVYDSATGHRLLIPQGTRLVGRYDSNVSFGQSRVLVIWTDLVFPNGSTLQIGGMPGMDAQGYSGFTDRVDNRYLQTFGSAILVALIGTGIDMAFPQSNTSPWQSQNSPEDAARRNFADTFGRIADQTISRNMDVQPTLEIRPGYQFNVFVEQDIVFPGAFNSTWGR